MAEKEIYIIPNREYKTNSWVNSFIRKARNNSRQNMYVNNLYDYVILSEIQIPKYKGFYIDENTYINENELNINEIKIGKYIINEEFLDNLFRLLESKQIDEEE